jgi:hypothetical protein
LKRICEETCVSGPSLLIRRCICNIPQSMNARLPVGNPPPTLPRSSKSDPQHVRMEFWRGTALSYMSNLRSLGGPWLSR